MITSNVAAMAYLLALPVSVSASNILWSSTGGGWRSMAGVIGFGNLFNQAGILDTDGTAESSGKPHISSICTTSGSTWFSTQFFYSQNFNNITLNGSPQDLYNFVTAWMNEYLTLSNNILKSNSGDSCPLPNFASSGNSVAQNLAQLDQECDIFLHYNGDWAAFITDMLTNVSTHVYNDQGFAARDASRENRVSTMQTTDLLIQTSLGSTMRLKPSSSSVNSTEVYQLGPAPPGTGVASQPTGAHVYTTFTPVVYVVDGNTSTPDGYFLFKGVNTSNEPPSTNLLPPPILIYNGPFDPHNFNYNDYINYGLWPTKTDNLVINAANDVWDSGSSSSSSGYTRVRMSAPFSGNTPTTVQLASISSAASGGMSPLIPSALAQYTSPNWFNLENETLVLKGYEYGISLLYDLSILFDIAICSQWPNSCGASDARFADGYFCDNPSLPNNLAHHQRKHGISNEPLKIIVTDTNLAAINNLTSFADSSLLSYFSTTWNQGVAPGDYIWAPTQVTPFPSPQIFKDMVTVSDLRANIHRIPGSNHTYYLFNATTIDNPVYHVQAGQTVEILWIQINSLIPTGVIGPTDIELYLNMTAATARDVAANTVLLNAVQNFVGQSSSGNTSNGSGAGSGSGSGFGSGGTSGTNVVQQPGRWSLAVLYMTALVSGYLSGMW